MSTLTGEEIVDGYLEVYLAGGTMRDLAKKLGMSNTTLMSRRYQLRKKGVKLPMLASGKQTYTQEYIDKLNGKVDKALSQLNRTK